MTASVKKPSRVDEPLLAEGMRLDAEEFHRRYCLLPDLNKSELIEGIVHMPSAVTRKHAVADGALICWAGQYSMMTPGVFGLGGASNRLNSFNELQPDLQFFISEDGADPLLAEWDDDILHGPTELVAEVSVGSRHRDWVKKFAIYEAAGFPEYLVWQVDERVVEWFRLVGSRYQPLERDSDGIHRSVSLPGLWLDSSALVKGDMLAVLETLNQGLACPEHQAFVESLRTKPPE